MRSSFSRNFSTGTSFIYIPLLVRGIAVILVIFLIPLEFILRNLLISHEDSLIEYIQTSESESLNYFFKAAIYTGNHVIIVLILPILYNCIDTVITFKITIVTCHVLYLYSFIAVLFTEPRPYWVHSNIKGINCQDGFGTPSEEVLLAMVFYTCFIIEVIERNYKALRYFCFILVALWICLLAYTEMYLGENFPHQIAVTLCLGYIYLTVVLSLDSFISNISLTSCYYTNKNRPMKVYWFISNMALLLIIIVLNVNVNADNDTSITWIKNAYKECKFTKDIGGAYSFNQSSWILYNTGAVFGSMLASKKLPFGWWKTTWRLKLFRSIISSGVSFGIFIGFNSIETYDETSQYTFNYTIPAFLCAYISFGVLPIIFQKISLNSELSQGSESLFMSGISMPNMP